MREQRVANSLKRSETFTPELIQALRETEKGETTKAEGRTSN
jgi:hypothetical protein